MRPDITCSETDRKPTLRQLVGSVLSAAIGIQTRKNRERDFKHGNIKIFVLAGITFVAFFVTTVFFVVKLVLSHNGY